MGNDFIAFQVALGYGTKDTVVEDKYCVLGKDARTGGWRVIDAHILTESAAFRRAIAAKMFFNVPAYCPIISPNGSPYDEVKGVPHG